jgi:ribonuclease HI/exonuclease III
MKLEEPASNTEDVRTPHNNKQQQQHHTHDTIEQEWSDYTDEELGLLASELAQDELTAQVSDGVDDWDNVTSKSASRLRIMSRKCDSLLCVQQNVQAVRTDERIRQAVGNLVLLQPDIIILTEIRRTGALAFKRYFDSLGYDSILSQQVSDYQQLGCMMVINKMLQRHKVAELTNDRLCGRGIGLVLQIQGGKRLLVTAGYSPTGIDQLPLWAKSGAIKEDEVRRGIAQLDVARGISGRRKQSREWKNARIAVALHAMVLDWHQQYHCDMSVHLGDFNETVLAADRYPRPQGSATMTASIIEQVLMQNGWADGYTMNKNTPEAPHNDAEAARSTWFTYSGRTGTSTRLVRSRIDHCLVNGVRNVHCDHLPAVLSGTQHNLVTVLVETRVIDRRIAAELRFPRRPRNISNWDEAQWDKMRIATEEKLNGDQHLLHMLESLTAAVGPIGGAVKTLERAEVRFRQRVIQTLQQVAGFTSGRPHIDKQRLDLVRKRTMLCKLKMMVTQHQSHMPSSRDRINRLLVKLAGVDDAFRDVTSSGNLDEILRPALRETRRELRRIDADKMKQHKADMRTEPAVTTVRRVMNTALSPPLVAIFDTEHDKLVNSPAKCKQMLAGHFEQLFKHGAVLPNQAKISERELRAMERSMYEPVKVPGGCYDSLMADCTVEEVKQHAFPTRLVAAGPDLLSGGVLGHLVRRSDTIAGMIATLFNAALRLKHMPSSSRHSEIVPLVKTILKMTSLDNLRPISLQVALFKGLHRLLALRLGYIVTKHKILHEAQEGFLPGRSTHRAVELVRSVWNQARKGHQSCFNIFYDISKAYDSIEHEDLLRAMRRLAMPEAFVQYVKSTMTGLTSCVRTVYGVSQSFRVQRGIRQGDPLAPLLFVCLMDILHVALHKADKGRAGYPFILGNKKRVVRVASGGFADDTWVTSQTMQGMWKLHQVQLVFAVLHNLQLHATKSVAVGVEARAARSLDLEVTYHDHAELVPSMKIKRVQVVDWKRSRCCIAGKELIAEGRHYVMKHLGVLMSMSLRSQPVGSHINRILTMHEAIARSNRLSFALVAVQQQQWTNNTIEHSIRFAGCTKEAQKIQTRVLRNAGRVRRGHPNRFALHLLAGVSRVEARKVAANLSDFITVSNGDDRLSQVVRQGWRDLPQSKVQGPRGSSSKTRSTAVMAERAVTAAAKVGWIIRAKHTMQLELGNAAAVNHEAARHNTRARDSVLNPMLQLCSRRLHHTEGLPTASSRCTHKWVTLRGQQYELVFGGFTGTYTSMVESPSNPTDEMNPLVLYTDGGWVDSSEAAKQTCSTAPLKPVAAFGVCVADDNLLKNWNQVAGEADMTSQERFNQCVALNICTYAGPISGHHSARAYAAELMGILIALAAAPVTWFVEIRSDSESAINSIAAYMQRSAVQHRMQEPCHALLYCCCWVIAAKKQAGAIVKFAKVKGHDADATVNAVGNRVADLAVDRMIDTVKADYAAIYTSNEQGIDRTVLCWEDAQWAAAAHDFTFLQHGSSRYIILASVRADVKLIERQHLLHGWMGIKEQAMFLEPALVPVEKQQLYNFRQNPRISSFLLRAFTNGVEWDSYSVFLNEEESRVVTEDNDKDKRLFCCCCARVLTFSHVLGQCSDPVQRVKRRETIAAMCGVVHGDARFDLPGDDVRIAVQSILGIPADECSEVKGALASLGIWARQDPHIMRVALGRAANNAKQAENLMRSWSSCLAQLCFDLMASSKITCCRSDHTIMPVWRWQPEPSAID